MCRVIFTSILFCYALSCLAQITTFSKRNHFDMTGVILTSIIATDSCYYATGVVRDSVPPYRSGTTFVKLDLEGNPLFIKSIISPDALYATWCPNLKQTSDNNFAVVGYKITVDNIFALLIKYNTQGDTLFIGTYDDPFEYEADDFYRTDELAFTLDEGYILGGNASRAINESDIVITKVDSLGNLEKIYSYIFEDWSSDVGKIIPSEDGGYYIGGLLENSGQIANNGIPFIGFDYKVLIFKIDSIGNKVWEYISEESLLGVKDMIVEEDGSFVIATDYHYEYIHNSIASYSLYQPYIYKINSEGEKIWSTFIREERWKEANQISKLIKLKDESGYIIVGKVLSGPEASSVLARKDWGVMAKVSQEGDSLWRRHHYMILEDYTFHEIYDIKETADGGFIMCGKSEQYSIDGQPSDDSDATQQGWLIKVDEYGCLVPGCHFPDAINSPLESIRFQLYPNPTSDFLNIFFKTKTKPKDGLFRVIDINGRVVKKFEPEGLEATYTLPVYNMAKGIYFLQYLEGNDLQYTEKFIVQ